ncbi:MAG: rod shape-determining protein [Candidatus Dojkabacteria bacterium]
MSKLDNFLNKFSAQIAIDLGTANIRVLVSGEKEVIKEPAVVAINKSNNKVMAVGLEARKMIGRTPANIVALQPLKAGVISDFNSCEAIISYFIHKVSKNFSIVSKIIKPTVVIGVPSLITEVEIKAVMDSAKQAGAGRVYVVEEPMAAAIGSNLKIDEATASMIVDIGGGTTDIAIISMGGILVDNTVKVGGDNMDKAIVDYIKSKYNLLIPLKMAEDVKVSRGAAIVNQSKEKITLRGQDLLTGLPKSLDITPGELSEAIMPILEEIVKSIKEAMEKAPSEIISDLIVNGICLTGGGAMIQGLNKFLSGKLKVNVIVPDDPIFSVIKGLNKLIKRRELLDKIQIQDFILR